MNGDGYPDVVTLSHAGSYVAIVLNQYATSQGGGPPDFAITANPSTVNASGSGTATTTITISPVNGFNQSVSFSCSGLPAHATSTFSPATVTPNGSPVMTTLTITTGVQTAMLHNTPHLGDAQPVASASASTAPPARAPTSFSSHKALYWLFGVVFLGAFFTAVDSRALHQPGSRRFVRCFVSIFLMSFAVVLWTHCGGNGNQNNGGGGSSGGGNNTPAGTYSVTVQASGGTVNHSTTITLTVH